MSIAEQIINGTYGNNKKISGTSIAESIINGSFEEKRKKREEELKKTQEQRKKENLNKIDNQNSRFNMRLPIKNNTMNDINSHIQKEPISNTKEGTRITLKDAEAMEEADQVNRDIQNKNYNSSISHMLNSFPEGVKKGITGIANAGLIPAAEKAQKISNEGKKIGILNEDNLLDRTVNKLLDASDKLNERATYRDKVNKYIENDIVRTVSTVNNQIGNMVPSMVANVAVPGSGLLVTGVSSGGNSARETINEDRSNLKEAVHTGILKGAVEAGTEKLTGGNLISKGSLDDIAGKFISEKVKSNVGKFIANKAYGFLGEMTEEQISDNAGYIIDKLINNKDLPSFNEWWNNAGETNKVTFLSTLALNLAGLGGGDVSKEYESKINEVMNIAQKDPEIQKQIEEVKGIQNQTQGELNNTLNNKKLPMQQYQYEKSENNKINRLRQDANRYFNNTEKSHNFVNMLEKIIIDKDIDIRLDSNLKTVDGKIANGSYSNGIITINPNSTRAGEFIAIHELTHAIGTDQMKNMIDTYRKSNVEFNSAVENILQNYKSTEINEEVLADISGQLFGTQEFINNISRNNPDIFQKIYSEIKYLWHQFRGYKNQNQFVEDLYYKWTQAYNNSKLNKSSSFSIQTNSDGSKYVQVDTDQNIFEGKSIKEQTKIAQEYILNNFREKGLLKDYKTINVTRKTANEYTHPKNGLDNTTYSSKMKASTELDNLLEISKFIKSESDDGRHIFAKNGWDYYETVFKVGDKTYSGWLNIANGENGKLLYDITNIKERASNYSVKTVSVANSSINNSIPSSNKDVNTTKYSMQESENNSFSMQDNQGRTLTKEQQEYFKDSKVRDENGNLLEVYHGTEANSGIPKEYWFTIFDIDKSKISTMGDGFYFTDNYDRASSYAHSKGNVYKSYLNITNPFTLKNNMTFEETVKSINPNYNIDNLKMENRNKFDGTKLRKYLIDNGYDGISLSGTYVAFNSNQIKNVSNTKPTSNPDIRYSQNNETWQSYLENNFNTNGTRTNLKDIKLPMKKDLKQQNKSNSTVVNQEVAEDNISRKSIIQKNRALAREKIKNIANWNDKSNGFKYQRETMERNMFDIIPNKQEAQDIIDTYFEPVHKSEAEKQKFINTYNEEIRKLNLNKYESEAVQLLGEQKYNPDFKADEISDVLERVNKNIKNGKVNKSKVEKAIETFRSTYDKLFDIENQVLRENGYSEKPYRKGYFPHFIDSEPVTRTEKLLDKFGFKIDKRPLPTDIAGITEQFVPGKTWNRSFLNRKTDKTTYNALKGFDTYIAQAADNIFHTENIQKLRALENEIRYQYSDKGIKDRIDAIYNDNILTQEEKQATIEKIFEQVNNPMPNLVVELRRYTNALANKKSEADRSAEQKYGRQIYSTVNAIENRFGANAVGLNIGSAITNFIPITQAYSQVSTKNMGRATLDTIKSYIQDDGFVDKSTFLTNRINKSEKLYKTSLEKISDKTSFLFNAIDDVTSNIIVRGKYLENINNGMSETEAIKNADRFAANLIADRSKGSLPTLFEEKSPLTKAFTQFQLEVNNQYSYMFKDIPRDLKEKGLGSIALAYFKMFIAAFMYNWASKRITGRKAAFSPIDIAVSTYDTMSDSNTKTADKLINVGKDIVEEVPFVGSFFGGGRIPISGAFPDGENTFKAMTGLITGEMNPDKAIKSLKSEMSKPLYYLVPPFGGAQAKKTIEGISTVANGGSYGIDSKGKETLNFPVENAELGTYLKAGIFGKYSLPEAKYYTNNNYKSLNAKQTEMYKESRLPYKQLLEYINTGLKKKEDKIGYLENQTLTEQQKWGIYKYDILSNTEREDGGSQLSDAEYIVSNGVSKTEFIKLYNKAQKNNIDIPTEKEYKKIQSSGIKLKNYIDYKIKDKIETQKQREEGKLKKSQSLKTKDKIQILLASNYSNKEIGGIYENYIKSEKDTEYDIVVNKAGMNVKTYLEYKQQEFESDKKDDGTVNGKTISKSKQNKVVSYLNTMKISGNQRLLLYAMQGYTTTSAQKKQLAQYVQELPLKSNEKLKLFDKFSGFKVDKNGRVTY